MPDPAAPAPPTPGERRLARPPSDRYRAVETAVAPLPDPAASRTRAVVFGAIAGLAGSAAIIVLGGVLAVTAGLLVVAVAIGWGVGAGVLAGGGATLDRGARTRLSLALTLGAVALGQAGLWAYARSEGGVLGPLEYLWDVFGLLVPLELAAAAITGWIVAR